MKKIKEIQDRKKLGEGRDYGIGFSILKKIKKDTFETYNAFTACRDYLNDFAYVEKTKKEIGSVYGYNHKLLNCFDKKQIFYIGVKTLDFNKNKNNPWSKLEECKTTLITNYKNLEKFLNDLEVKIGLSKLTQITLDEDTLIIKSPIYWTKSTALMSVYTLLIRCYFNITNEQTANSSFEQILNNNQTFITDDKYMITYCKEFYQQIMKDKKLFNSMGKTFDKEINKQSLSGIVHNYGISAFLTDLKT